MKETDKRNDHGKVAYMESIVAAFFVTFLIGIIMFFAVLFTDETKLYLVESVKIASMMGFGAYFLLYGYKERKKLFIIVGASQIILQILRLIDFFTDYIIG
ncbi:MAG: hypothetical protein IKM61_07820 [Eubacteriaceae bacterium]|nr:hypothetical protein [Eubacteriaceae bacterium]